MEIVPLETMQRNLKRCDSEKLCGICKQRLGRQRVFALDLPTMILRVTPQAPMHQQCAMEVVNAEQNKGRLFAVVSCIDYEKVHDTNGTLYLRPNMKGIAVHWWIDSRPATADDVLVHVSDKNMMAVLKGADAFEGMTRTRICAEAYSMLELIETKFLPRLK